MNSDSRFNSSMQNPPSDQYTSPSANKYSPSVPISVYRELAAELQAAQAMVDTLKAQNQQLVKQNQQLRQEVEKVVQSAQNLQQMVVSLGSVSGVEVPTLQSFMQPEPRPVAPTLPRPTASVPAIEFPPPPQAPEPTPSPYPETLVIEEDSRPRRSPISEGLSDVSGWLLVVAILLIVLTAFGTGFLIVRPLLKNNR